MQNDLCNLHELARRLRLKLSWLRDEADAGRIPCLKAGRSRLFSYEAVERSLAARAAAPAPSRDVREDGAT